MKRCSTCQCIKVEDEFYKNNNCVGGLSTVCRDCFSKKRDLRFKKHKEFIQRFKLMKGCARCGYKRSASALCFAHIDPETKWSYGKSYKDSHKGGAINICWSLERIKDEIRKCEVLCANCHMEETHE